MVAVAEIKANLKTAGDQYVGPNAHHHDEEGGVTANTH